MRVALRLYRAVNDELWDELGSQLKSGPSAVGIASTSAPLSNPP